MASSERSGQSHQPSSDEALHRDIMRYYDESWFDYRAVWLNTQNRALHMGYWDENTRNHGESLITMNRELVSRATIPKNARILDAGCGVGGSSMWLAKEYGASVVGITLVRSQIERAQRYAAERGLEKQVTFLQQDYLNTAFPDNTFDLVWTQESACYASDKRALLAEAYRVLKPGGYIVSGEPLRRKRPYSAEDEAMLHRGLASWAIPDLATGDELVQWGNELGFKNVKMEDISPHVRKSLLRLHRVTLMLYPLAWVLYALRMRTKTQQENMRGARYQWLAFKNDLWFYGIFSAQKPPQ